MPALSEGVPVSVIIPAYNEEVSLGLLLEDLRVQERPPAEVIVVDAGSTDRTAEVARAYAPWVRVIQVDRAYPGQARNIGVAYAQYPIIAFWDGEMRVAPQTLKHLCEPILSGKADFAQGRLYLREGGDVFWVYATILLGSFVVDEKGIYSLHPVACCAMKKSLYMQVGGCPPYRASEDHIFRWAVERSGARIVEEPEAISWWSPQVTAMGLFRKTRLYARHNLIAGDLLRWFRQLYGYYAGLLLVVLLVGLLWSWGRGLLAGVFLWVGLIGARSTWHLWRKRGIIRQALAFRRSLSWGYLPKVVPWLIAVTDIASWLGFFDWLILDKVGIAPERYSEPQLKTPVA
jgi:glycosyltransferase involved in cell wall biosynthesis